MVAVNVTINDPSNLASAVPLLVPTIHAAVDYLDRYLVLRGTVDVAVFVETTANGRFAGNGDITQAGQRGGFQVWESSLASEARTGIDPDPTQSDLRIFIDPLSSYLAGLWWDPIIGTSLTASIPGDRTDAFSVVLHELLHGMGINGWRDWDTGALPGDYASAWDYWVSISGGKATFNGPATTALLGEPVEVRLGGSQGATHLGNGPDTRASAQPWLERSNLNGYYYYFGERYTLGRLELALLQDVGWTLDSDVEITDVVNRWNGRDTPLYIVGWDTAEKLSGGPIFDRMEGRGGNDFIDGGSGDDILLGGSGGDALDGGDGDDTLDGGDGDDEFHASPGADFIDGGAGTDRLLLDYSVLGNAVTDLRLMTWLVDIGGPPISVNLSGAFGTQTVGSIEQTYVVLTPFDDNVGLTDRNDTLFGGAGNDRLDSAGGDDVADGGDGKDHVYGSYGNDTVHGGAGDDTLGGGQGNDTLIGGSGYDRVRFGPNDGQAPGTALKMDFTAVDFSQSVVVLTDAAGGKDTLQEIEAVFIDGTSFGDWVMLSSGNDIAYGGGGNDTLAGNDGDDLLGGGAGDDFLAGGAGNDTLDGGANGQFGDFADYGGAPSGVTVNLATGIAGDGYGGTDALVDVEHIRDSAFDDLLTGNAGTNWFRLGAGNDTVDGSGGRDVVFFEDSPAGVNVNLLTGITAGAAIGTDVLKSIEAVHGSHFDDVVVLSNTGGYVFARAGSDLLIGGAGGNTFHPGSDSDTLIGGAGFDVVDYSDDGFDGAGPTKQAVNVNLAIGIAIDGWGDADSLVSIEGVIGTDVDDILIGGTEYNVFRGRGGADRLIGGLGADTFRFLATADSPLAGWDVIDDFSSSDLVDFTGLAGCTLSPNIFAWAGAVATTVDAIKADLDLANRLVFFSDGTDGFLYVNGAGTGNSFDGSLVELKGRTVAPAAHQIVGQVIAGSTRSGDAADNVLLGSLGFDAFNGQAGNDIFFGLGGNDALDGGEGRDIAWYLFYRSAYGVARSGDTITITGPEGTDALMAVERAIFADSALAFDIDGNAGQTYRLYQAAFAREPEVPGLSFWIGVMDNGAALETVAAAFIGSAEFTGLYGANPSNEQFVTLLYQNVLNRLPDAAGLAFWVNQLKAGTITRPEVLIGFSESVENKANVLPAITNGIAYNAAGFPGTGTAGNDQLVGTASADTFSALAGRDLLIGLGGNDQLNGGADLDTAGYGGTRNQYLVVYNPATGGITVTDTGGVDGIDALAEIERLQFADKNLAFDIAGNAGQTYRLYQAAFARTPDTPGLSFWIGQMDSGAALLGVAGQFISSAEFTAKYGANPSNGDFVTALYQNVLNRLPDQAGLDFWVNQLDAATISRPEVLIGFSESTENQVALIGVLQQGIEYLPVG